MYYWNDLLGSSEEQADGTLLLSLSEDPSHRPRCGRCGSDCVLVHGWLDAGERITHRLRAWVEALVQLLPIAHVAELTGLHWHTIKRIEAVAMDMSTAFDLEVRAHCPNAEVVYDLFHVSSATSRRSSSTSCWPPTRRWRPSIS